MINIIQGAQSYFTFGTSKLLRATDTNVLKIL